MCFDSFCFVCLESRVEFQTRERNSLFRDFVFSYFRCRQLHYYYYLKFQQKKVWKILVVVLVLTNTQYVMVKIIKQLSFVVQQERWEINFQGCHFYSTVEDFPKFSFTFQFYMPFTIVCFLSFFTQKFQNRIYQFTKCFKFFTTFFKTKIIFQC